MSSEDVFGEIFNCSFCKKNFIDVIKFIQDCMNSICCECYQAILDEAEHSWTFKCKICDIDHDLPKTGLSDDKRLLKMLQTRNKGKIEQAQSLRILLGNMIMELNHLELFEKNILVDEYSEKLEQSVRETADSAIRHIEHIKDQLIEQIRIYKEQNEQNNPDVYYQLCNRRDELSINIRAFEDEWSQYFDRWDVQKTEAEIMTAQTQANDFSGLVQELLAKMVEVSKGQLLEFKVNDAFFKETTQLGRLFKKFDSSQFSL